MVRNALLLFGAALLQADAHFTMTWPPSRVQSSMANAGLCRGDNPSVVPQNGTCLWFSNECFIGCRSCGSCGPSERINATLPEKYWSWPDMSGDPKEPNPFKSNPWRAPGRAPVYSPCGIAGGVYHGPGGHPGNGGFPPAGVTLGFDGRNLSMNTQIEWEAGSKQEVATAVNANHGGGYSLRLARKTQGQELTEECFKQGHLKFSGNKQWLQWGTDKKSRVEIDALRAEEGTHPEGSQWTRFPIPACGGRWGGDDAGESDVPGRLQAGPECNRTQFKPPVPGLFGHGLTQCLVPDTNIHNNYQRHDIPTRNCTDKTIKRVEKLFNVNVVDLVEVPADLPAGDYVLSWRHDSEQTPQVWANCADIKVTAASATASV